VQPDVASVFITEELTRRRQSRPGIFRDTLPFHDLTKKMVDDPKQVLPLLVDTAMELCEAVSGGISLYEPEPAPGVFRWHYLRGDLEKFSGATTPRHYSPCGITLDRRSPVLVQRPERVYTWLQDASVSLPECLLVPLYIGSDEPLGTLWIVSEKEGQFDGKHADALADLAGFAGLALRMAADQQKLKETLDAQQMLTREMAHRLKNLVAVAHGLVDMASRQEGTAEELAARVMRSLEALASAQTLVAPAGGQPGSSGPSDLAVLVRALLAPYGQARSSLNGPDVAVASQAKNILALIFHELATNATKYGALSSDRGTVNVNWTCDAGRLLIRWEERDGPRIVSCPTKHGFGTVLAAKSIKALEGTITPEWGNEGLSVTIEVPLASLGR